MASALVIDPGFARLFPLPFIYLLFELSLLLASMSSDLRRLTSGLCMAPLCSMRPLRQKRRARAGKEWQQILMSKG